MPENERRSLFWPTLRRFAWVTVGHALAIMVCVALAIGIISGIGYGLGALIRRYPEAMGYAALVFILGLIVALLSAMAIGAKRTFHELWLECRQSEIEAHD